MNVVQPHYPQAQQIHSKAVSPGERFSSLNQWLAWQEQLHPQAIDLGLDRMNSVLTRLGVSTPAPVVVTVAGTNGKGSTVAFMDAILRAQGYRTAAYTSPHLLRYNERVRINGAEVGDSALCEVFAEIDGARCGSPLTYFEFGTLAALALFQRASLDVALLEVGMGGRLDAVNCIDPDIAVVTALDVDHAAWLGADREAIALEKAGIFRAGRAAVCSDPHPPLSLLARAEALGVDLCVLGAQFRFQHTAKQSWSWRGRHWILEGLPLPALGGEFQLQNAAGALMAMELLREFLPVSAQAVSEGLRCVRLAGRCQRVPGPVSCIADVAHNPQAARVLARHLSLSRGPGRTLAVFSMLGDKDIAGVVSAMSSCIDHWYLGVLEGDRVASAEQLTEAVRDYSSAAFDVCDSVSQGWRAATRAAGPGDRVVVFGSFRTVAQVVQETL